MEQEKREAADTVAAENSALSAAEKAVSHADEAIRLGQKLVGAVEVNAEDLAKISEETGKAKKSAADAKTKAEKVQSAKVYQAVNRANAAAERAEKAFKDVRDYDQTLVRIRKAE